MLGLGHDTGSCSLGLDNCGLVNITDSVKLHENLVFKRFKSV